MTIGGPPVDAIGSHGGASNAATRCSNRWIRLVTIGRPPVDTIGSGGGASNAATRCSTRWTRSVTIGGPPVDAIDSGGGPSNVATRCPNRSTSRSSRTMAALISRADRYFRSESRSSWVSASVQKTVNNTTPRMLSCLVTGNPFFLQRWAVLRTTGPKGRTDRPGRQTDQRRRMYSPPRTRASVRPEGATERHN